MAKLKMKDIAGAMKHIDICMLATSGARGILESRPMSNNRQVEYKGSTYFFTLDDRTMISEIKKNNNVNLNFVGAPSLLKRSNIYISVIGKAKLIKDKKEFVKHWTKDLDAWFKNSILTPGLVMIEVKAKTIRYWDGMDEGVVKL